MTRSRSKRPGAIYACYVRSPRTGRRILGYVGKTRQWVKQRWQQHQESQPWADTIIEWRVVREWKDVSNVALWWAEVWRIVAMRPLYVRRRVPSV